jgi:putative FmdB family regulatory protein
MPIYEFYCSGCDTLLNFFSRRVAPDKRPDCPRCGKKGLDRQISPFASPKRRGEGAGGGGEDDGMGDLPVDESRMESAMEALAGEAENLNEDDPRQAAQLMRKFSKMTGLEFNENMQTALNRLEAGEDPDKIEEEMGGLMDGEEDPFVLPGQAGGKKGAAGAAPKRRVTRRDPTLYEL